MIKQIWFIRNERKLLNYVCLTIAGIIMFYSILCIWALAQTEYAILFNIDNNISQSVLYLLMVKRVNLIFLPIISLAVCITLFWLSNHTKPLKHCKDNQTALLQKQIKRDMLIGTNLFITLVFSFLQIHILNITKQIEGNGFMPIYACIAGVIIFYVIMIKKLLCSKQEDKENGL